MGAGQANRGNQNFPGGTPGGKGGRMAPAQGMTRALTPGGKGGQRSPQQPQQWDPTSLTADHSQRVAQQQWDPTSLTADHSQRVAQADWMRNRQFPQPIPGTGTFPPGGGWPTPSPPIILGSSAYDAPGSWTPGMSFPRDFPGQQGPIPGYGSTPEDHFRYLGGQGNYGDYLNRPGGWGNATPQWGSPVGLDVEARMNQQNQDLLKNLNRPGFTDRNYDGAIGLDDLGAQLTQQARFRDQANMDARYGQFPSNLHNVDRLGRDIQNIQRPPPWARASHDALGRQVQNMQRPMPQRPMPNRRRRGPGRRIGGGLGGGLGRARRLRNQANMDSQYGKFAGGEPGRPFDPTSLTRGGPGRKPPFDGMAGGGPVELIGKAFEGGTPPIYKLWEAMGMV